MKDFKRLNRNIKETIIVDVSKSLILLKQIELLYVICLQSGKWFTYHKLV